MGATEDRRRDTVDVAGRVLLWLAALTALAAAGSNVHAVLHAPQNAVVVESWRLFGLVAFAALFAWLARRPRSSRMVWTVVIGDKLALAATGIFLLRSGPAAVDAGGLVIWDGGLAVLLVLAFVCCRGWTGREGSMVDQPTTEQRLGQ